MAEKENSAGQARSWPELQADPARRIVSVKGREVRLTGTEFRLLEWFRQAPGQVFTRQELMKACVGEGIIVLERTIDQHVCSLRRKLGLGYITTVRGVGYRFQAPSLPAD